MKRIKRVSVLCVVGAVISAATGVYVAARQRHVDETVGVALFYAGAFLVFAAIARVIERATPSK